MRWLVLTPMLFFGAQPHACAFEHTKVLPKGVRNLTIRSVNTSIDYKTDAMGKLEPLSGQLEKDMTFGKVVQGESGTKRVQLEAFLQREGFSLEDSLGRTTGELKGEVRVYAPIFSYGVTDKLTLALAVPYYQAKMAVSMGFMPSEQAHRFVSRMADADYNLTQSAREVSGKLNHAGAVFNAKLRGHGFQELKDWRGQGLGDLTVASKYRMWENQIVSFASTQGLVLPTGRVNDPDILNDIPFGKGTLDAFASFLADEQLGKGFFLNQYSKYTYSFPGKSAYRMATEAEAVEVEKRSIGFKLGNQLEAGTSLQFEPDWGMVAGLGYVYAMKFSDRYDVPADVVNRKQVVEKLEGNTNTQAQFVEAKLGYSSVPAFKKGELAVPFSTTVEYKKHVASKNTYASDFVTLDMALYF